LDGGREKRQYIGNALSPTRRGKKYRNSLRTRDWGTTEGIGVSQRAKSGLREFRLAGGEGKEVRRTPTTSTEEVRGWAKKAFKKKGQRGQLIQGVN